MGLQIKQYTVKEWLAMRDQGKINTDMAYQRGLVSAWRKQSFVNAFVDSILQDLSINVLHAELMADGSLDLLDGKQRTHALARLLDGVDLVKGFNDDLDGRPLLDWPKAERQAFYDYKINVVLLDGLDDSTRLIQFLRLNGGVKLTSMQTRRGQVQEIVLNPAFASAVKRLHECLPPVAGRARPYDSAEEIALQALSYLACGNCSFKGVDVVKSLKAADKIVIDSAIEKLADNVRALNALWIVDNTVDLETGKAKPILKHIWRKSFLNVLLCNDLASSINLPGSLDRWQKRTIHAGYGVDQEKFKALTRAGSANAANVKARVAMIETIITGQASSNPLKATKKGEKILSSKKIELIKADTSMISLFRGTWGADTTDSDIGAVVSYVRAVNGSNPRPRRIVKGQALTVQFTNGKGSNSFVGLVDMIEAVNG